MLGIILKIAPWLMRAAPLLSVVKGKAKLIMGVISILSMLGGYWYVKNLQNTVSELEGSAILYVSQIEECQAANAGNQARILELTAINSSLAKAVEVSDDVRREAMNRAWWRERDANRELLRTGMELEVLRDANPSCKQLSEIDMGAYCPAIVQRLREQASKADRQD